jgi:hypothetical protein
MAHGAQAIRTTTQAITTATLTAISFSAVNFDSDVFWSAGNPTRLTCPASISGQFIVMANILWVVATASLRQVQIRKNGTTVIAEVESGTDAAGDCEQIAVGLCTLVPGDYIEVLVLQASGGTINTAVGTSYAPSLSISFQGS